MGGFRPRHPKELVRRRRQQMMQGSRKATLPMTDEDSHQQQELMPPVEAKMKSVMQGLLMESLLLPLATAPAATTLTTAQTPKMPRSMGDL
jgi:hypothetical protein